MRTPPSLPVPFRPAALALAVLALLAAQPVAQEGAAAQRVTPVVRVAREVGPAVVHVLQELGQAGPRPGEGLTSPTGPAGRRLTSLGSGFIIDEDGYILTSAHLIRSRVGRILVHLQDGAALVARLVAVDVENDLALLNVDTDHDLVAAPLGSSADLMVGETVIAIGNPLGQENSVTRGVVSAVARRLAPGARVQARHPGRRSPGFIQIDVALHEGSSGGPLLNVLGEVVGMSCAPGADSSGAALAIPVDRVRESLASRLFNPRLVREVSTGFSLGRGRQGHVLTVERVEPGGPAEAAGLRAGDALISLSGLPLRWEFDLGKALADASPGDRVRCLVRRGQATLETELHLLRSVSPGRAVQRRLGVRVTDHPRFHGAWVDDVDAEGPAGRLPLLRGDLIDGIDQEQVDDVQALHELLRRRPSGQVITLHLFRGDRAYRATLRLF